MEGGSPINKSLQHKLPSALGAWRASPGSTEKDTLSQGLKRSKILRAGEGQVGCLQGEGEIEERHTYSTGAETAQGGLGGLSFCPTIESLD